MSDLSPRSTARLEGKELAGRLLEETRAKVEGWTRSGRAAPTLRSVAVGEGSPFAVYQRQQGRTAERAGVRFEPVILPEQVSQQELESELQRADQDPSVHGVILQHPLPSGLDFDHAIALLRPAKDIDGVGAVNLGHLVARRPLHVPAVALAARDLLVQHRIPTAGRRVLVVGRSGTVGLPAALLLLLPGPMGDATVTVAHSRTRDLDGTLRQAEVIISCVGRPGLLRRENVAEGAWVIDVGLSTLPDPSKPQGVRIAGDADQASLEGWAGGLTPVPGGVGPVTVAELMANCAKGYQVQLGLEGAG